MLGVGVLNADQRNAIRWLAQRYGVEPPYEEFFHRSDLPPEHVCGPIGDKFAVISPDGNVTHLTNVTGAR